MEETPYQSLLVRGKQLGSYFDASRAINSIYFDNDFVLRIDQRHSDKYAVTALADMFLRDVLRADTMSLAFPSPDASTINISAYFTPNEAVKSKASMRTAYTVSLCIAMSTIIAAVDLLSVALLGTGTPWIFFPVLLAIYLAGGALLGGLLSILLIVVGQIKRQKSSESNLTTLVQRIALCSWLAIFSLVSLERLIGGNAKYADLSSKSHLVLLAIGFLVALITVVSWAFRQCKKSESSGIKISQIAVIAASFTWWAPFNNLFDVPMLSIASLLGNSFFIVSCFVGYRVVTYLSHCSMFRISLTNTNSCIRSTCLFAIAGLTLSSTVWAFNHPSAIDLPPLRQLDSTVVATANEKPNVVLIVMDTTRADHLSCYGYPKNTTPILSALAKESIVYKHAVSPSPWTLPAHASMFTGLYPRQHDAYCHPSDESMCQAYPLPQEQQTVAELLSSQGYDTAAVLGNWSILHRSFGLDQGFVYYDDRPRLAINSTIPNTLSPARWLPGLWHLLQSRGGPSRSAVEVNASALAWLDRPRDQPFFLFINYLDPHQPYESHPEFNDQLASSPSQYFEASQVDKPRSPIRPNLEGDITRYDQELAYVDAQIGQLLDVLRSKGLYDSSLIIVTSDHGEAFDEHGYLGHSNTVYEEEVHVPLIVRYPHSHKRGVVTNTTSLVDVATLITDALGHSPLNRNASMRNDHLDDEQTVFSERIRWLPKTDPQYGPTTSAVYLDNGMKVLLYETAKIDTRAYDLEADPFERYEIAARYPSHVEKAKALLETWLDRLRNLQFAISNQTRNAQLTENLKTLGYVGD